MVAVSAPIIVDCDTDPYLPEGWRVEKHLRGGKVELELRGDDKLYANAKIISRLEGMDNGRIVGGARLHEALEVTAPNANILDRLLENQALIPEGWKRDADGRPLSTFFHGTLYRHWGGGLCVRCLRFVGGRWDWSSSWIGCDWVASVPAVIIEYGS